MNTIGPRPAGNRRERQKEVACAIIEDAASAN